MFSSHVILDFRVEDYPSLKRETEVSLFCHNQNSDFFGNWIGTNWFLNVWENLPVWYSKCWLNLIPMCGYCVCSVMSDSLWPHGLQPARLLHPWDFLGKNMGVDCYFLLQGIFLTQGLNPGLPHCRQTLYYLSHRGSIFTIYFGLPSFLHLRAKKIFSLNFLKFFLKKVFLLLVW